MDQTRWLTEKEQQLWLELRDFSNGLARAIDRQLIRDSDVSGGEYAVLARVSESDGAVRSGDLASALGWDRSRVSHLLRRMEARGLVHRCTASDDGRGQDISLTETGWDKVYSAAPGHVTMVRETIFDPLTVTQQQEFLCMIRSIRAAAEARELW